MNKKPKEDSVLHKCPSLANTLIDYTHLRTFLHLFMVCSINKEQREGSGGLLVAQRGSLPARSKDGSVLKGFHPFQPETFALNLLLPALQRGIFILWHTMLDPLPNALSSWKSGHLCCSMFNMSNIYPSRDHRGS